VKLLKRATTTKALTWRRVIFIR